MMTVSVSTHFTTCEPTFSLSLHFIFTPSLFHFHSLSLSGGEAVKGQWDTQWWWCVSKWSDSSINDEPVKGSRVCTCTCACVRVCVCTDEQVCTDRCQRTHDVLPGEATVISRHVTRAPVQETCWVEQLKMQRATCNIQTQPLSPYLSSGYQLISMWQRTLIPTVNHKSTSLKSYQLSCTNVTI